MMEYDDQYIEVTVLEDKYGSLYPMPIHLLTIYNSLKEYMKANRLMMSEEDYTEDENILYQMKEIGNYDEEDIVRVIEQMSFIDQAKEYTLHSKYVLSMGVLRLTLYDKKLLHHTKEEVNVLASTFNDIPLQLFSRYDSILYNDALLKQAMQEGKDEKERCYYLFDEMYEIDQLYESDQQPKIH